MKRWILFAGILSGILVLSSCGLLPEEETFRTVPMVKTYEKEEFETTAVVRGDMQLVNKITGSYLPTQNENLYFTIGGEYYDAIFVKVGDSVKKGDLVAQLNLSGAQEAIDNCSPQINRLEKQISDLEENRKLELEKQKVLMSGRSEAELNEALERTNNQFDAQKQPLEDALTVAYIQLKEAKARLSERQLRAGMDGTIIYVREFEAEERNVVSDRVVSISNTSSALFRVETKHWKYLKPGDEYTVTANKKEYEAVVVSETDIGLEETEKQEGEMAYVYLQLKEPALDLEVQTSCWFELVRDGRTDVLMVPERAVTTLNGQSIVYYLDESGLKAYKQVETGLVADSMIEIVSGVTEGELIILD